jgi:uncharacterized protein (DUF362 family)
MTFNNKTFSRRRLWKPFCYLSLLIVWICWDLYQAHSSGTGYTSFVNASSATLKSPAATTVALVRSNDPVLADPCDVATDGIPYTTVYQMVKRAVNLAGGLNRIIKAGDTVLIKPNIVEQDSSGSGGVTDVRVVKALVYLIDSIAHGQIKIIVGDGSARPCTPWEQASGGSGTVWVQLFDVPGYQTLKTGALADGINFRLSNLNGNTDTTSNPQNDLDSVAIVGGGQALPHGGGYFVDKDVTHATVYISVPVLKIHEQPGLTCALKNQIGLAAGSRYGFNKQKGVKEDNFSRLLYHQNLMSTTAQNWQDKEIVDLCVIAKIKFAVVDAITCLQTQKTPLYGVDKSSKNITNRVVLNTIVAGEDPVAVDNVCCRMIGINPDDIEHITLAERVGIGTNNTDSITILGSAVSLPIQRLKKPITTYGVYGQSNRVWMLNGHYSASDTSAMSTQFIANEATVAPVAGLGGWSQPIYFTDDQIMLGSYYSSAGSGPLVSYAFTYFNVPSDTSAELWVGSDEALRVYLNENLIYNYKGTRTFIGTEWYKDTSTVIPLKKGLNKLLVKAYQSIGTYNFSLNICQRMDTTTTPRYRGNRVSGLKFVSSPLITGVQTLASAHIRNFELRNCYPNPFNPATVISYQLLNAGKVKLTIYDMLGRELTTLVNEQKAAGTYSVTWNASGFSSGVYFYRLNFGNLSQVKKMVLVK